MRGGPVRKFLIELTEELYQCLEKIGQPMGPFIEQVLRRNADVRRARDELGIEFKDRPKMGRPKKQKDGES